ncbi:MAG: hypothetical protein K2J11_10420 [Oscillospiraceae bacterium]|nr:hypothetical protein [Oscillospiraceae bacterium]
MVIEIEYYECDTLLYGSKVSFSEFKNQMNTIENLYDRTEDNFVALLCRMYNWEVIEDETKPQYVYDRDIKKCINLS